MNAGDPRVGEHPREAFFRGGRFQRHAVNVQLRAGGAEQEARFAGNFESRAQLVPCGFELGGGTRMPELIQARKLQQNVEAVYKPARYSGLGFASHAWDAAQETLPSALVSYLGVLALTRAQAKCCHVVATRLG